LFVVLTVGCTPTAPGRRPGPPAADGQARPDPSIRSAAEARGRLPLYFVENIGQIEDPGVGYQIDLHGGVAYLRSGAMTMSLTGSTLPAGSDRPTLARWRVQTTFVGADAGVMPSGVDKTEALFSYLVGPSERNVGGAPSYSGATYAGLWPGIDLVYGQRDRHLEDTFVVQAGADPGLIRMDVQGATDVVVREDGSLDVVTPVGGYREQAPSAYQELDGQRVPVDVRFDLTSDPEIGASQYGFTVGSYNPSLPLVIDPTVLLYGTYIGGAAEETGDSIALGSDHAAYVAGHTLSDEATFPNGLGMASVNAPGFDTSFNGSGGCTDVFVTKLDQTGTSLSYATYLGGTGCDTPYYIAVRNGEAYISGDTFSGDFGHAGANGHDQAFGGGPVAEDADDGFLIKLNAQGTAPAYFTYLGGDGGDFATAVAVNSSGEAWVCGGSASDGSVNGDFFVFGGAPGFDKTHNGGLDAYVVEMSADGIMFQYGSFIGGDDTDACNGLGLGANGDVYISGDTSSTEDTFPNGQGFNSLVGVNGFDRTYNDQVGQPKTSDAFAIRFNPSTENLAYATYIGGHAAEQAFGIAADNLGNAWVTGRTSSGDGSFPIAGSSFDGSHNGDVDGYAVELDGGGNLAYGTFLGSAGADLAADVRIDADGNPHVAGYTYDASFPNGQGFASLNPPVPGFDQSYNGAGEAFLVRISSDRSKLSYASFFGGSDDDILSSLAIDSDGNDYVVGSSASMETTFPNGQGFSSITPVVPGFDKTLNNNVGTHDAIVLKIGLNPGVPAQADVQMVSNVDAPDPATVGQPLTYTLTVRNNGPDPAAGVTVTDTIPATTAFVSAQPSPGCAFASGTVTCPLGTLTLGATRTVTIVVTPGAAANLTDIATVATTTADPVPANNSAAASTRAATATCITRPRVGLQTAVVNQGGVPRLRATLTAQTSGQVTANNVAAVQFTSLSNARINVLPSGPNNQTAPFVYTPATTVQQVQFDLFRVTAGQAATARVIVTDACGAWETLVGAGPGVGI
jgi:uncharacterized repeat protein (TIGR01451 family)